MSLIQVLKEDHMFFRERFLQLKTLATALEVGGSPSLMLALVTEIRKRHKVHLRRETELLIPGLVAAYKKKKIKPTDPFLLLHLEEEHLSVGRNLYLLEQVLGTSPVNPDWLVTLGKVVASYLPHMENEEKSLFPEAEKYLTADQLEIMAHSPISEGE